MFYVVWVLRHPSSQGRERQAATSLHTLAVSIPSGSFLEGQLLEGKLDKLELFQRERETTLQLKVCITWEKSMKWES